MDIRRWLQVQHLTEASRRERPMTITLPQLKCLQRDPDPPATNNGHAAPNREALATSFTSNAR
jgi:hypothetical protein